MKSLFFVFAFVTSIFLANTVFAQWNLPGYPGVDVHFISTLLNIPDQYLAFPNFIYNLLIPFIAIWAIVLGFLRAIRIFPRSRGLETIIAFTISFATLPSGVFIGIVSWFLALMGVYAVVIFFGLFLFGVAMFAGITGGGWLSAASLGRVEKDLKVAKKQLHDIENQMRNTDPMDVDKMRGLEEERQGKKKRIYELEAEYDRAVLERKAMREES